MPLTRTITIFNFRDKQIKIIKVMDIHGKTAAACLINWMSTIKKNSNTTPRFGSTGVTGEIIHVNIVVGKVGPIFATLSLFREILRSLIYMLWHGEIVMVGSGCGLNI